jgi:hypothetical protein
MEATAMVDPEVGGHDKNRFPTIIGPIIDID